MTPAKRRQYGTGSVYQRGSDGRWFGVIDAGYNKNGTRRRITVSAKTEAEAKTRLKLKARDLDRGEDTSSRTTVKVWAEKWLVITEKTVRPNTHTADLAAARWIIEAIGHKRLDQLTPSDVRSVSVALDKAGRSSSTANRYHGTLQRMLKAATAEGLPVPPRVLVVDAPTPAVTDRRAIPTPEALAILHAASTLPHWSRWVAAFLQGMRGGEANGLLWENVRADHYVVSWQLQPLPYKVPRDRKSGFRVPNGYEARQLVGQMHLVRPKSKAGWRVIPLLPAMSEALEAWRLVAPDSPHGLVWPALDGSPANEHEDREEFKALQGAACVGHPAGRYYYPHEARHGLATMLLELGAPEAVRTAIMGHSSIASTAAYEHVDTDEMRRFLEGVAGRLQLG